MAGHNRNEINSFWYNYSTDAEADKKNAGTLWWWCCFIIIFEIDFWDIKEPRPSFLCMKMIVLERKTNIVLVKKLCNLPDLGFSISGLVSSLSTGAGYAIRNRLPWASTCTTLCEGRLLLEVVSLRLHRKQKHILSSPHTKYLQEVYNM